MDRKPLAPSPESRDERLTVRLTHSEMIDWRAAAQQAGEETSRYFRRCAAIGRKVREARALSEAAGA